MTQFDYDFFISRAGADKDVSQQVEKTLIEAGYAVISQDKDFGSASFMAKMSEAIKRSRKMIAILSEEYEKSEYTEAEYSNFLKSDPNNKKQRFILLRVKQHKPTGILSSIPYICLLDVLDKPADFSKAVLNAVGHPANSETSPLSAVAERLPTAWKVVDKLSTLNSEGRLVMGVSGVLSGLEELACGQLDVPQLARYTRQIDYFVREAETKQIDVSSDGFSFGDLKDMLNRFPHEAEQIADGTVPNDWVIDETLKHKTLINDILQEIKSLQDMLSRVTDLTKRRTAKLLLCELQSEVCLHPLSLQQINTIRTRLDALQEDVFRELLINCQLLLGRHVNQLTPGKGEVFRDTRHSPELVVIPPGAFLMGSADGEGYYSERPQHKVTINYPLAVGRFAVTFDEWDYYISQQARAYKPSDESWGRGKRPVINVFWDDAQGYVNWLTKETGRYYRLLSESEWEYACRAGSDTHFWWGNEISSAQANYNGIRTFGNSSKGEYREQTVPVDSFEPNPWGVYNVHGNVREWCEDWWHDTYYGAPIDGSAWLEGSGGEGALRIVRGGSWDCNSRYLRAYDRSWLHRLASGRGGREVGFRVARVLTNES